MYINIHYYTPMKVNTSIRSFDGGGGAVKIWYGPLCRITFSSGPLWSMAMTFDLRKLTLYFYNLRVDFLFKR